MTEVRRIDPGGHPATVAEVIEAADLLLKSNAEHPGVLQVDGAIGLLRGLLETVECTCQPKSGRLATVLELPLNTDNDKTDGS